ncbi:MAG: VWA domain-containing protein [Thermomicrobiales bacterium]
MSGLSLLAPIGLAALVGIPLVILLHMRNTTPRLRPVPTLRFWLVTLQEQRERTSFRRPPISLLMLLQLAIVALVAFALARPITTSALSGLGQRTEPRHLIVLLDGSTSMAATDTPNGKTRFEAARQEAMNWIDDLREGDVATVIVLGTNTANLEATDAASFRTLRDRLATLPQPGGRADLNAALNLAGDLLLPDLEDRVVVITDGALTADPNSIAHVAASIDYVHVGGATTGNIAITDLSTRSSITNPDQEQIYVRVANFSADSATIPIELTVDGISEAKSDLTINPNGGAETTDWDLPSGSKTATVTIGANDALSQDNTASTVLTSPGDLSLKILLVSDTPSALQRALTVLPGAQVTTVGTDDPAAKDPNAPFDLVVYDTFSPDPNTLAKSPVLFVNPPENGILQTRGVMQNPTVLRVRADDPLLEGVELAGVTFGETTVLVMDGSDTEVAAAEAGPLIYRGTLSQTGAPVVALAFDVAKSNLPRRVAFPILIANITGFLAPSPLPSALPLGDPLAYRPRADAATVRITPPDGVAVDLAVSTNEQTDDGTSDQLREVAYPGTGVPGAYKVTELDADGHELGGGTFIVNAGHQRESDLRANPDLPALLANTNPDSPGKARTSTSDLWPTLVAAALAVLLFEWLVTILPRRRKRRSATTATQPGSASSG